MEALILRRNYPVPVTFADLRRAAADPAIFWAGPWAMLSKTEHSHVARVRSWWHAALKSATGATDDVYAVVDGREVHVTRVDSPSYEMRERKVRGVTGAMVHDLQEKADEQGYWERPHEVRLVLQERAPSLKAIDAVVQRSLIEAEVRR